MVAAGIDALVTGTLSSKADTVLRAAGIDVCLGGMDAVLTLVEKVREGVFRPATEGNIAPE